MKEEENIKYIAKTFKKLTKNKFLSPQNCTQLHQTRASIFELNKIIKHFERKFDYVPPSAQLLFYEFNNRQERILFEKYLEEFSND